MDKFGYERMRIAITLFLMLSITSIAVGNPSTQTDAGTLSVRDEREVRAFARRFAETARLTRDLALFLNQAPASTTLDRVLSGTEDPIGPVQLEVRNKVTRSELRQFYLAMLNLGYLSNLYIYGKFSLKEHAIRDLPFEQQYPVKVARLLKSNATIAKWWKDSDSPDYSEKTVETVLQLRSLLATWQKAAALMRIHFKTHPPERTMVYRRNLRYVADRLKEIEADACDNEKSCAGLPLHTEVIKVNVPVLQLMLVRLNGRLKILAIGLHDD